MRTLTTAARPTYRLTFQLPRAIARVAASRVRSLTLDGCTLEILDGGLVAITAPSRDSSFNQAAAVLRARGGNEPPASIAAVLETPSPRGRDGWIIIVGADVAFAPTGLPAHFPLVEHGPAEKPPPDLLLVANK